MSKRNITKETAIGYNHLFTDLDIEKMIGKEAVEKLMESPHFQQNGSDGDVITVFHSAVCSALEKSHVLIEQLMGYFEYPEYSDMKDLTPQQIADKLNAVLQIIQDPLKYHEY